MLLMQLVCYLFNRRIPTENYHWGIYCI